MPRGTRQNPEQLARFGELEQVEAYLARVRPRAFRDSSPSAEAFLHWCDPYAGQLRHACSREGIAAALARHKPWAPGRVRSCGSIRSALGPDRLAVTLQAVTDALAAAFGSGRFPVDL